MPRSRRIRLVMVLATIAVALTAMFSFTQTSKSAITDSLLDSYDPLGCISGPEISGFFSEVPVCDKVVRKHVRVQTEILSNGKNGVLEQLQLGNQLLAQMNNTIGRPSITTVMLPVYIGKATVMMSGMSGLSSQTNGTKDTTKQGILSKGFSDKPLFSLTDLGGGFSGGGILDMGMEALGGGDLAGSLMGALGVDPNSLQGKLLGDVLNFAFTGNFSVQDLLGLARNQCGENCNIKIGGLSVNPLDLFAGALENQQFNVTNFLYGDSICKILNNENTTMCDGIMAAYDTATGNGSVLDNALAFLNKNGLKGETYSGGDKDTAEEWGIVSPDAYATTIVATNYLNPEDEESWKKPENIATIQGNRQRDLVMGNMLNQMQGQSILHNTPILFKELIKGNNTPECAKLFADANAKLAKSFSADKTSSGGSDINVKLKGDCVTLTNMMTQSRSLRGDVQAMIAVKYTDLLMSMAQVNMLASSSVAQGASTTLAAPLAVVPPERDAAE